MFDLIGQQFWQYGLIILAIVALLGLKAYIFRSRLSKQLDQYVHPSVFLQEIKKKVTSPEEAEKILSINLNNQIDHQRLRNISILVALINDFKYHSKCSKLIRSKLTNLPNLSIASKRYLNYIL